MAGWEIDEECTANQRGTESPPLVEVLDDEELPVDSSEIEGCTANQEPDDDEVVDSSEIEDYKSLCLEPQANGQFCQLCQALFFPWLSVCPFLQ